MVTYFVLVPVSLKQLIHLRDGEPHVPLPHRFHASVVEPIDRSETLRISSNPVSGQRQAQVRDADFHPSELLPDRGPSHQSVNLLPQEWL
jgi:hypothetical protein